MTAGLATLGAVSEDDYTLMNQKVDRLVEGYRAAADKNNIDLQINRAGSMMGVFFTDQPVTNFDEAQTSDLELFKKYYQGMIEEGIFLPPSQFEGLFMSTAHTDEDIEQTIKRLIKCLQHYKATYSLKLIPPRHKISRGISFNK